MSPADVGLLRYGPPLSLAARRRRMPQADQRLVERVLMQTRAKQTLDDAEDQARQWHTAWLRALSTLEQHTVPPASPSEWSW